jgi:very-short-patch-repair endonuclease
MGRNKVIRENVCQNCNNTFDPGRHKEKKTCSEECLKEYKLKTKEDRIKKSKEAIKIKYGVEHISQVNGWYEKVKNTKKEKYGDENYNNRKQAKETLISTYGVDNSMKIEDTIKKTKKTKKEKYGDENYNNREQAKETCLKKYGEEHHLKNNDCLEKMKKTNIEKYKTEFTVNTIKSIEELKKINNKKYGSNWYFESDEHIKKIYESQIKKLSNILKERELNFDLSKYTKIGQKTSTGYIKNFLYEIKCEKCNNNFFIPLKKEYMICRNCNPIEFNGSNLQLIIKNILDELQIAYKINDRKTINPYELDFYIEKHNIAIEVNGNYWHSETAGGKNRNYHINKSKLCQKNGIKLIHIFEDEIIFNENIIKSRLKNIFNCNSEKIYARNCEVYIPSKQEKIKFLEENHIQGSSIDSIVYALKHNDNIVSIMTFSKKRISMGYKDNSKNEWELIRFCSKINISVIGGFSKLLSYFKKNNQYETIITYADCRWSGISPSDTVYSKNNFSFEKLTQPNYWYVEKNNYFSRKHRFSYTKHKLIEAFNGDKNKTEWELAKENGFDRIWDCGSMKFIIEN